MASQEQKYKCVLLLQREGGFGTMFGTGTPNKLSAYKG
jgi:hypothetical protein